MTFDTHDNLVITTVAVAPSPATSGLTLTVATGDGFLFSTPPFNATAWPPNVRPTRANAEIIRVTGIATDTLTFDRATTTEPTPIGPQAISVGWQIAESITAKALIDIESASDDLGDYKLVNAITDYSLWSGTPPVGDGLTDDTAQINAAINYCYSQGGGQVLLSPGQNLSGHTCGYRTTNTIVVPPGVTLMGEGTDATKILVDFSSTTNFDGVRVGRLANLSSGSDCGLRDLAILPMHDGINQDAYYAGLVTGIDNVVIENVIVGYAGTNARTGEPQGGNLIAFTGGQFDTGYMMNASGDNTVVINNLTAIGNSYGLWTGAMIGNLGTQAFMTNVQFAGGDGMRFWWGQGIEIHGVGVSSANKADILIDGPDSGGPLNTFPSDRIRGTFVQGLVIRDINSYGGGESAVQIVPYNDRSPAHDPTLAISTAAGPIGPSTSVSLPYLEALTLNPYGPSVILCLCDGTGSFSGTMSNLTDTQGNTYLFQGIYPGGGTEGGMVIYQGQILHPVTTSDSVTLHTASGTWSSLYAVGFALDQFTAPQDIGLVNAIGQYSSPGSQTLTQIGSPFVGSMGVVVAVADTSITPDPSWTTLFNGGISGAETVVSYQSAGYTKPTYSYTFSETNQSAAVLFRFVAGGGYGTETQAIEIDNIQSNGVYSGGPVVIVSKLDRLGNDMPLGNEDNFQAVWVRDFWNNGSGNEVAHIGACQGVYLLDNVFIEPIYTFDSPVGDCVVISQYADHVTVKGNKFVRYTNNAAPISGGGVAKAPNGITIQDGADRYIVTENEFSTEVITNPINDLGTTINKVVANNLS